MGAGGVFVFGYGSGADVAMSVGRSKKLAGIVCVRGGEPYQTNQHQEGGNFKTDAIRFQWESDPHPSPRPPSPSPPPSNVTTLTLAGSSCFVNEDVIGDIYRFISRRVQRYDRGIDRLNGRRR